MYAGMLRDVYGGDGEVRPVRAMVMATDGPPAEAERLLNDEEKQHKIDMLGMYTAMCGIDEGTSHEYRLVLGTPVPGVADGTKVSNTSTRLAVWDLSRLTHDLLFLLTHNTGTTSPTLKSLIRSMRRPLTLATTTMELEQHFWADERKDIVELASGKRPPKATPADTRRAIKTICIREAPDVALQMCPVRSFATQNSASEDPAAGPTPKLERGQRSAQETADFAHMCASELAIVSEWTRGYEALIEHGLLPKHWRPVGLFGPDNGGRHSELQLEYEQHAIATGVPNAVPNAAEAWRSLLNEEKVSDAAGTLNPEAAPYLAAARNGAGGSPADAWSQAAAAASESPPAAAPQVAPQAAPPARAGKRGNRHAKQVDDEAALEARAVAQGNTAVTPDAGAALVRLAAQDKRRAAMHGQQQVNRVVSSEIVSTSGNKLSGDDAAALLKRRAPRFVAEKPAVLPPGVLNAAATAAVDNGGLLKIRWIDAREYNAARSVFTAQEAYARVTGSERNGFVARYTHDEGGHEMRSVFQRRFPWPGTYVIEATPMPDDAMPDRPATDVLADVPGDLESGNGAMPADVAPVRHLMNMNPRMMTPEHIAAMGTRMAPAALRQYGTLHPGDRFKMTFYLIDGDSDALRTHEFVVTAKHTAGIDTGSICVARASDLDAAGHPPGHIIPRGKNSIKVMPFPPERHQFVTKIHSIRRRGHESFDDHAARAAGATVEEVARAFRGERDTTQDFRRRQ
jgi:hypothetical protein